MRIIKFLPGSFLILLLALALGACYPNGPNSPYISTLPAAPTPTLAPTLTSTQAEAIAEVILSPTPSGPREYTAVILGLDQTAARCERDERCDLLDPPHSDIFLVVHVAMPDLPKATVVLVPRSLYVPPEMMKHGTGFEWNDPMWSMQVYGRLGFEGIRTYVAVVFGLDVDAVLTINMDQFSGLIDRMGGLAVDDFPEAMDGASVLAYLRDNDNNWGCSTYDCEGRIFTIARSLRARVPDLVFWTLGSEGIYETDLTFTQFLTYLREYYAFEDQGGTVEFVRLWRPDPLESNDTPLDVRGLVPVRPVYEWMAEILESR